MSAEEKNEQLIKEVLEAYEIPQQWVLASRYDKQTDTVIIVTHGGKKIVHKVGSAIGQKPTMVEISGFLPKEELFWVERLGQKISKNELISK